MSVKVVLIIVLFLIMPWRVLRTSIVVIHRKIFGSKESMEASQWEIIRHNLQITCVWRAQVVSWYYTLQYTSDITDNKCIVYIATTRNSRFMNGF